MKGKILASFFLIVCGIMMINSCSKSAAESTADWNIYENEKHGYSLMYPTDCFFGPMPSDCKEKPPEERRAECLCFLDSKNPDNVFLQAFLDDGENLSLATFTVSHYDSGVFNPPPGTDLASWINENYSEMFEDIPEEPNMVIGGVPAVRLYSPQSPMAPSFEDIWFFHNDILFQINILDVDIQSNRELYDQLLSTFRLED
jgi:hypothetical protein